MELDNVADLHPDEVERFSKILREFKASIPQGVPNSDSGSNVYSRNGKQDSGHSTLAGRAEAKGRIRRFGERSWFNGLRDTFAVDVRSAVSGDSVRFEPRVYRRIRDA